MLQLRYLLLLLITGTTAQTTFAVTCNSGCDSNTQYLLDGVGNALLNLVEGTTYTFNVNVASLHPFHLVTEQTGPIIDVTTPAATGQGTTSGTVTWTPASAGTFYYRCGNHAAMVGTISVDPASTSPSLSLSSSVSVSPSLSSSSSASSGQTPTASASDSLSSSVTSSSTCTPSVTSSATRTPTTSPTLSESASSSASSGQTPTASATPSHSESAAASLSPGASPSATSSVSQSPTRTPTASSGQTPTASASASASSGQTPTASSSDSPSASTSATSSNSPTPSASSGQTPTASSSATGSPSPSSSTLASQSATSSRSNSASISSFSTPTSSETPTASVSVGSSPSSTASNTQSRSGTSSVSNSASVGLTPTASSTESASESASASVSGSASPSASAGQTPTASTTSTVGSSATASQSETPTASRTESVSASSGQTPTSSRSGTTTASESASSGQTPTASVTRGLTPTASVTSGLTPTASTTETASVSVSASVTPSRSESPTPFPSRTPSKTSSLSSTSSPSSTPSRSSSPSLTPTRTSSPTMTPSRTATPSVTPSLSESRTISISGTPTRTVTPTSSASVSASITATPSTTPDCRQGCYHGDCIRSIGFCQCEEYYVGSACESPQRMTISDCTAGCTQDLVGGLTVQLVGEGLHINQTVSPAGVAVVAGVVEMRFNGLLISATASPDGTTVTFIAPAVASKGFGAIRLFNARNNNTVARGVPVYYVLSCIPAGRAFINGECVECPEGAACPGGGRMWSMPGYWSRDEHEQPVPCAIPSSCLGSGGYNLDGSRITSLCDSFGGFAGDYCSGCVEGKYRDDGRCRPCSEDEEATRKSRVDFKILLATIGVMVALIIFGIIFFSVGILNNWISKLVLLQQAIYVGRNAGKFIDGETGEKIGDVFRNMSILLLDVEFLRPACQLPHVTFVSVFWGTLVAFVCAGAAMFGGSALHALYMRRKCTTGRCARDQTHHMREFSFYFKTRATYAMVVLANIIYLQVCIRIFQAIQCVQGRLLAELVTECYTGSHMPVGAFAWILLFLFAVGFPILMFVILVQAYKHKKMPDVADHMFGYFAQGVEERYFWFRAGQLVISFILAALTALLYNAASKIFAGLVTFVFNFVLAGLIWPFTGYLNNIATLGVGLFTGGQVVVFLYFLGPDERSHALFYAAVTVLPVVVVVVFFIRIRTLTNFCKTGGKNHMTCKKIVVEDCCSQLTFKVRGGSVNSAPEDSDEANESPGASSTSYYPSHHSIDLDPIGEQTSSSSCAKQLGKQQKLTAFGHGHRKWRQERDRVHARYHNGETDTPTETHVMVARRKGERKTRYAEGERYLKQFQKLGPATTVAFFDPNELDEAVPNEDNVVFNAEANETANAEEYGGVEEEDFF